MFSSILILTLKEPNEDTVKALEELEEMEKGTKETKTYENIDKLMEDLNK